MYYNIDLCILVTAYNLTQLKQIKMGRIKKYSKRSHSSKKKRTKNREEHVSDYVDIDED
jgi:hypothetical protein